MSIEPGTVINGKYEVIRELGAGGFGQVLCVRDHALQLERALKVIPIDQPNDIVAKLQEARILALCEHKHVLEVRAADVAIIENQPHVVIECKLMANGSIQSLLEHGFLSLKAAANMVRQALFGLDHLHANGILHCDIKPGNLLLDDAMTIKLSDFGLAMHIHTQSGPTSVYTLHCAPEYLTHRKWDKASDVYAMGVTLYRLVNNIADFGATKPANLFQRIADGKFPCRTSYRPYVPRKLKSICNKAMNADPAKRFLSASDFGQSLDRLAWNVEWYQEPPHVWRGRDIKNEYRLVASKKQNGWEIEAHRNGRKYAKWCRASLPDQAAASAEMAALVRDTSLS